MQVTAALEKSLIISLMLISFCVVNVKCMGSSSSSDSNSRQHNARIALYNNQVSSQGLTVSLVSKKDSLQHFTRAIIPNCVNYVTVHGFATGSENVWAHKLKDNILRSYNANVFIITWSEFNEKELTLIDVEMEQSKIVADLLAKFINILQLRDMHFIAHSIGVGIASAAIGNIMNEVMLLTALDPYGNLRLKSLSGLPPTINGPRNKANSQKHNQAKFTAVFHSDSGNLGTRRKSGSVDIYLNGGFNMPGCENFVEERSLLHKTNCNHKFAAKFFKSVSLLAFERLNNLNLDIQKRSLTVEVNKCFPVAYMCDSYESFMSGYCATCFGIENGTATKKCFYAGLPTIDRNVSSNQQIQRQHKLIHTLATDANGDCVFTYRILVGIRKTRKTEQSSNDRGANAVFVRIALSNAPNHSRTVELSNKSGDFQLNMALFKQFVSSQKVLELFDMSTKARRLLSPYNLEYRPALVTFKSGPNFHLGLSSNCLDKPLNELPVVDVFGSNIESPEFVAIDYMSHFDAVVRQKHSFLFVKSQIIEERRRQDLPFFNYSATFSCRPENH